MTDYSRHGRLMKTKGMPIHTIIAHRLIKREDWEAAGGAVYPKNRDWWLPLPSGRWKYAGPGPRTYNEIRRSSNRA